MQENYTEENICCIALGLIKGLGHAYMSRLMNHFGAAEAVFLANPKELVQHTSVPRSVASEIFSKKTIADAENLVTLHTKNQIGIFTPWDCRYPQRLKAITNPPLILFCKTTNYGHLNHARTVSIVGTRNATTYGKRVVETLVQELAAQSVLIISGLAYGIDIAAHKSAILADLPTVAVYAGGIDMVYPREHALVAKEIVEQGALITEYPLGTKVEQYHFVLRNRIVAGMSDAVIVVEAPKKSGALITAEYANEYNREVFAVPGQIFDKISAGCHDLIFKNRAHLLTNVGDMLYIMAWQEPIRAQNAKIEQMRLDLAPDLTEKEKLLLKIISSKQDGMHIDEICNTSKLESGVLAMMLLQLEMNDLIVSMPGRHYQVGKHTR